MYQFWVKDRLREGEIFESWNAWYYLLFTKKKEKEKKEGIMRSRSHPSPPPPGPKGRTSLPFLSTRPHGSRRQRRRHAGVGEKDAARCTRQAVASNPLRARARNAIFLPCFLPTQSLECNIDWLLFSDGQFSDNQLSVSIFLGFVDRPQGGCHDPGLQRRPSWPRRQSLPCPRAAGSWYFTSLTSRTHTHTHTQVLKLLVDFAAFVLLEELKERLRQASVDTSMLETLALLNGHDPEEVVRPNQDVMPLPNGINKKRKQMQDGYLLLAAAAACFPLLLQ